jgi:hypothetical protein
MEDGQTSVFFALLASCNSLTLLVTPAASSIFPAGLFDLVYLFILFQTLYTLPNTTNGKLSGRGLNVVLSDRVEESQYTE